MRDAQTEALLTAVNASARAAVAAGCTPDSVVWEATAGAFAKPGQGSWPDADARRKADAARRGVQPTACVPNRMAP